MLVQRPIGQRSLRAWGVTDGRLSNHIGGLNVFFNSFLLCVFCFSPVWMLQPVNELRCAMQGRLRCDCRTWCVRWLVPVPYLRHHLMHSSSKGTMYHLHRHLICMIQEVYHKYLSMPIPASVWDKSNRGSLMFFAYGIFYIFLLATLAIRDRNQPTRTLVCCFEGWRIALCCRSSCQICS